MSMPSLPALRAFNAAARLGSFKAAANELNVSSTAISHHVRGLEAQIGVALFKREARQVLLTDAGHELAEATSFAFSRIENTVETLRASESTLSIATTPAFAALWLAPRIQSFEARHSDILVRITSSTEAVDLHKDSRTDVAIRYGSDHGEAFEPAVIIKETILAFGTPDYIDGLNDLSTAQLISTKWISDKLKPTTWLDWGKVSGESQSAITGVREFHQEQEVMQAGLCGQGLILLSDILAQDMVQRNWLHPFRPHIQLPGYIYSVLANPLRKDTKKVQQFLAWLTQELATL